MPDAFVFQPQERPGGDLAVGYLDGGASLNNPFVPSRETASSAWGSGNLLANAAKYGAGGPVDLIVEDLGPSARLDVVDRGIGISPGDQGRIFDRFERAVSERHYGGFGLGLWLSRQIVEAHGGTIEVTSAPGVGSTFTVLLPKSRPSS